MLFLNYLNAQQNTRTSEKNLALAKQTFEATNTLNQQRLLSERFSTALTKLGDETMAVRLGGIFSLERLARDSKEQQSSIIEVLSYFLREHSEVRALLLQQNSLDSKKLVELEITIQAALSAIARCCNDENSTTGMPDLSLINFNFLKLRNISIPKMNFTSANLKGFQLYNGTLIGSNLRGCCLESADLQFSDLRTVDLSAANLHKADLSHSYLSSAVLQDAFMQEVKLCKADLTDTNLSRVDLKYSNLSYADMTNADLSRAELQGADFSGTNLVNTDLSEANLQEADFSSAKGLEPSQIQVSKNWRLAVFSHAFREVLGL